MSMQPQEKKLLFLPIDDVKFEDLFDWADPLHRSRSHHVDEITLKKQKSITSGIQIDLNAENLALFRVGGDVYAITAICPHAGGPLYLGDIEELPGSLLCVRCPWHSWRFDLKTGSSRLPCRADVNATVFPVRVMGDGSLSIGFQSLSSEFFNGDF